jgi:PHP family Zn ribbon phosphoesterase
MRVVADLHIHSRFARACSPQLTPENLDLWSRIKGIDLLSTGDFTHPGWFAELAEKLEPAGGDLYQLKKTFQKTEPRFPEEQIAPVRFLFGTELSSIYSEGGKVRRVHNLVFTPSVEGAQAIIQTLTKRGANLRADGRPIIGVPSRELLKMLLDLDPRNILIPAHAWTPWFAVFGSKSGYDSLEECFGDLTKHVFAIETGLSSDPPMNWRVGALDEVALISSSDAHSLPNLARESIILEGESLSYDSLFNAIKNGSPNARKQEKKESLSLTRTIEFFPDEGMYHFDGHREHKIRLTPQETKKKKGVCPICSRPLTIGVLHRVDDLATEPEGRVPDRAVPFTSLVELDKIIAESLNIKSRASKKVQEEFWTLVAAAKGELPLLLELKLDDIAAFAPARIVEAVRRLREGKVAHIEPGYDGEYGHVSLFDEKEKVSGQKKLFED